MSENDKRDALIVVSAVTMAGVILYAALAGVAAMQCAARWSNSHFEYRTKMLTCLIKTNDGWVPASTYRAN